MSRRTVLPHHQVLSSQDSSSDFQSNSSEVSGVDVIAYDVEVDSTVQGSMYVEYSNEPLERDATWKRLDFGESTAVDGSTETQYRFQVQTSFKRSRLSWVNNSGTGNISASVFGLVRGA